MFNKIFNLIIFLIIVFFNSVRAEINGDVYLSGVSKYLWRGQELYNSFALQPGFDLYYKYFSFGLWNSFHVEKKELYEIDLTLSYSVTFKKYILLKTGYTYYSQPKEEYLDSHELFLNLIFDWKVSPVLKVFYDFDDGNGFYTEFVVLCPFKLGINFSFDVSLGYNYGQWNYDPSFTVMTLNLNSKISAGKFDIIPSILGQISFDKQYKNDFVGSLNVIWNF